MNRNIWTTRRNSRSNRCLAVSPLYNMWTVILWGTPDRLIDRSSRYIALSFPISISLALSSFPLELYFCVYHCEPLRLLSSQICFHIQSNPWLHPITCSIFETTFTWVPIRPPLTAARLTISPQTTPSSATVSFIAATSPLVNYRYPISSELLHLLTIPDFTVQFLPDLNWVSFISLLSVRSMPPLRRLFRLLNCWHSISRALTARLGFKIL